MSTTQLKEQNVYSVMNNMTTYDHEQVVFCQDKKTGLKAIIAVHDTTLGPALGGTRMWNYANDMEALNDVLRLSRGMTYKAAISGLNLGGGKAVIIGDSRTQKSEALFRRFGKFVNSLGGKYITAEDVGISPKDIVYAAMETKHVTGLPQELGGTGDPSPVTAYGVYMGMKASAKKVYGNDNLEGKVVAVQGVGHVGAYLVDYLIKENAKVLITDIHDDVIQSVINKHPQVTYVAPQDIYSQNMDIYAPCALGATVNDDTIDLLKCAIIAGAANNQLANEEKHGELVRQKGILYAPDFLINAGGLINCYSEIIGLSLDASYTKSEDIYATTLEIYKKSEEQNIPTYKAANLVAEARIESIAHLKRSF
jgi:leucine dehydrogenase